jgi:cytoskeletal protein RodZ
MVGALPTASTGSVADNIQSEPTVRVASTVTDDRLEMKRSVKLTAQDTVTDNPPATENVVSEKPVAETPALFPAAHATTYDDFDAKTGKEIILEATEDSWIRLADTNGTEIWSGVLRKGELYRPTVPETVVLTTSNAGGVRLNLAANEANAPLGDRGEILTDFTIKLPN